MNKTKKNIALLLLVCLVMTVLSGCGQSTSKQSEA